MTRFVLTVAFGLAAVFLASCEGPQDSSSHHSSGEELLPNVTWYVAPSMEEQIYDALKDDSLVIVRASLLSLTEKTEIVQEGLATTYRPVHELRFNVHEYLEGSGPNEILVVVRDESTFPTEADARSWLNFVASQRNTSWDSHQAVLFASLDEATPESSSVRKAGFVSPSPLESPWDYTVDTLSRSWLAS